MTTWSKWIPFRLFWRGVHPATEKLHPPGRVTWLWKQQISYMFQPTNLGASMSECMVAWPVLTRRTDSIVPGARLSHRICVCVWCVCRGVGDFSPAFGNHKTGYPSLFSTFAMAGDRGEARRGAGSDLAPQLWHPATCVGKGLERRAGVKLKKWLNKGNAVFFCMSQGQTETVVMFDD